MVERNKQELADQLKEVTTQLRTTEELKKEADDQVFFLKDDVKELNEQVKAGLDKINRYSNDVSRFNLFSFIFSLLACGKLLTITVFSIST